MTAPIRPLYTSLAALAATAPDPALAPASQWEVPGPAPEMIMAARHHMTIAREGGPGSANAARAALAALEKYHIGRVAIYHLLRTELAALATSKDHALIEHLNGMLTRPHLYASEEAAILEEIYVVIEHARTSLRPGRRGQR